MDLLRDTGLVLHISGISLMVGMSIAAFVTYRRLFIVLAEDKNSGASLIATAELFSKLQLPGGLLIILGGMLMMSAFQGLIAGQLWFKIKLLLLVLLIVNVPLNFRPANKRLQRFLTAADPELSDILKAKGLLNRFFIIQLLLFFGIFTLSVFRFNGY